MQSFSSYFTTPRPALPTGVLSVRAAESPDDPLHLRHTPEAGRASGGDQEAASMTSAASRSLCTPPSDAASPPYSRSSALGAKCCRSEARSACTTTFLAVRESSSAHAPARTHRITGSRWTTWMVPARCG
eukprot:scaffold108680_cov64-Phaeocystis_antarctica.AAC.3